MERLQSMTDAASDRPAVTRLLMTDMGNRKRQHGTELGDRRRPLQFALPRHRSNPQRLRCFGDAGQFADAIEVGEMVRSDQAWVQ